MRKTINVPGIQTAPGAIFRPSFFRALGFIFLFSGIAAAASALASALALRGSAPETFPQKDISQPHRKCEFKVACFSDFSGAVDAPEAVCGKIDASGAAFALVAGDLTNGRGRAESLFVREMLENKLSIPFAAVPGNHDIRKGGDASAFTGIFGPGFIWFGYGDTLFIGLDTSNGFSGEAQSYLRDTLNRVRGKYRRCVVFCHIFPSVCYDRTAPPWLNDSAEFKKALGKHKINLLIVGHLHCFYETEFAGVRTIVLPSAGQIVRDPDNPNYGFAMLEFMNDGKINVSRIDVKALNGSSPLQYFCKVTLKNPLWKTLSLLLTSLGIMLLTPCRKPEPAQMEGRPS